jgi:AsmA protein
MGKKKKVLLISGAAFILFALAIFGFLIFSDINAYKPRIEAAASRALGMDVRINGKIKLAFLPHFGVSLRDVTIRNRGSDIFYAERVRAGLLLIPLMKHEIRIGDIEFIRPRFSIEHDRDGTFNFEKPGERPEKESRASPFSVEKVSISKGDFSYLDKRSGSSTEMKGVDLTLRGLSSGGNADILRGLSFMGEMKCREFTSKNVRSSNLSSGIRAENGTYALKPLTVEIFKGAGKGDISIDLKKELSLLEIRGTVSKFSFEEFVRSFSERKIVEGKGDLSLTLSAKGKNLNEMKGAFQGEVSVQGANLILYKLDLDALLSEYEKSQSFNLVDVGAFLFAGPLGTTLTKGYDFAGVYKESLGGKGTIERLVSRWEVRNNVAEAKDVAFTTKRNRVAVKGQIDFLHERFDNVTVAVLDEKGCARFSQKISGGFHNPKIEKPGTLQSVAGPVLKLFEKTKKFVAEGKCKVFYSGSLAHPK